MLMAEERAKGDGCVNKQVSEIRLGMMFKPNKEGVKSAISNISQDISSDLS